MSASLRVLAFPGSGGGEALAEVDGWGELATSPSFSEADGELWAQSSAEGGQWLPKRYANLPHLEDANTGERLSILWADTSAQVLDSGWVEDNAVTFTKSANGPLILGGTYNAWLRTELQGWRARGIYRVLVVIEPYTTAGGAPDLSGMPALCIYGANQGGGGGESGVWVDLTSGASGGQQRARLTNHDRAPINSNDFGPVDWGASGLPLVCLLDWSAPDSLTRYGQSWLRGADHERRTQADRSLLISGPGYDGQIWLVPGMYLTGAGTLKIKNLGIYNATSLSL